MRNSFTYALIILIATALGACSGGNSSSSNTPVMNVNLPVQPAAPTSETIRVETQKTEGNHSIVMPGAIVNLTCTTDIAGTAITWSSSDTDVSFANINALSTNVTIGGANSRRVDVICSDNNSDASGTAPIFVNTSTETNFRINPLQAGNMFAQQISTNADPAPGCLDETPASLGADYVWVTYDERFSLGCSGAYSLVEDGGQTIQVITKLREIFGIGVDHPVVFLFGDMVLEKDRAYSFQTTASFGDRPIRLGGQVNTSGTDVITIKAIQTQKTVNGITYADCIDYNFGHPNPNIMSFYCDINNSVGDPAWALFLFDAG